MAEETPFDKVQRKMVAARREFMAQLARFRLDELSVRPAEGEWSPIELAYHVYIADGLALEEMQRVQNEDTPLIGALDEEAPRRTREAEKPVTLDAVLAGMAARREEIFQYLIDLPVEAWERPYRYHTDERKFYQLVNVLPAHDQTHAQQLAAMKP